MRYLFYIFLLILPFSVLFSQSKFDLGVKAMSEEKWNKAISFFQEDRDSSYTAEADYNIGLCYIGLEDVNTALYYFEKALKSSPFNDRIIENASLSFNKLYPDESWSHPYSGFKRIILSVSTNGWIAISILLSLTLSWMLHSLITHERIKRNRNIIVLIIGLPVLLFALYGANETYNHSRVIHYFIPKSNEVVTFLTVDGVEAEEKLQIGRRYEISSASENDWIRFKGAGNTALWVKKSEVNTY